jgi:Flp pilus assembly protein TadB
VITEAEESPQQQLRHRQRQYLGLMLLRVVCLILAAVLVSLDVPYALVWVLILTVGMVAFPWMAVMVANDRPPKAENRFSNRFHRGARGAASSQALPIPTDEPSRPELPPSNAKIIDPDQ